MRHYFLDTTAYSAFKRAHPELLSLVSAADRISVNATVMGELFSGFDLGRFRDANRRELRAFVAHPAVTILPITEETAERYSHIFQYLRRQGTPIPTNDIWIAASVMENGTSLLTMDRHFLQVPQIHAIMVA